MAEAISAPSGNPGWLRNAGFDTTFIWGIAAAAMLSGMVVAVRPELFTWVLMADLWLLGYHHVISTFTRLAFDRQSLRTYRFYVFGLPIIVFGVTFLLAFGIGIWVIASVYLYWQWFHYTRQSWGISRVYEAKAAEAVNENPLFAKLCFYLLPTWGILYRSWQAPDEFLFVELRVIPVPEFLVQAVGFAAVSALAIWGYQRLRAWQAGRLPIAHTCYMLSHFGIFSLGYLIIEDITYGWLVINIWHNAQYILFVWLFNTNRFKSGEDPKAPFLSRISQPSNMVAYMLWCLLISTTVYLGTSLLANGQQLAGLPLVVLMYQAVNFHHYIVDSLIWKVRKKPMQETLNLTGP